VTEIPTEVWRYSSRLGLYFRDGVGEGLTFDELAERTDYVAGHDDAPKFRLEFGPPMDEEDDEF
jgi:hypothetical protein